MKDIYEVHLNRYLKKNAIVVPTTIYHIMIDIMKVRDKIHYGNSFVEAFLDNDLSKVIEYGDNDVLKNLRILMMVKNNCTLK